MKYYDNKGETHEKYFSALGTNIKEWFTTSVKPKLDVKKVKEKFQKKDKKVDK